MNVARVSLFSQLLALVPRSAFNRLVRKHQAEYRTKGFRCWDQFVAMMFCQVAQAKSLREILYGLKSSFRKLMHLGIDKAPARSTLAYANRHRPAALYRDLFFMMLNHLRGQAGLRQKKHRFGFENPLYLLDATIISLSLKMFPWADYNRTKGGLKLNMLLEAKDYLPYYAAVDPARLHEIRFARELQKRLTRGSIVAMDKGYMDMGMLIQWNEAGIFFILPLKQGLGFRPVKRRKLARGGAVLCDMLISCTGESSSRYRDLLRLVEIEITDRDGGKRTLELLTNQLDFSAELIGEIYKERWEIELFFKTLKQNFELKYFVGLNENALTIQIWTALLALLIMKWLKYRSEFEWGFSTMVAAIRMHLFEHRVLEEFLASPDSPPPGKGNPNQLKLAL